MSIKDKFYYLLHKSEKYTQTEAGIDTALTQAVSRNYEGSFIKGLKK